MSVDPSAVTAAEPARGTSTVEVAQTVGKYRLERILGTGGMGVVWAAFDPDLERAVALKLLHSEDSEPTLRTRLLREARAMARLRHPNVVTVFDVGTDRNRDYIAMDLVEGGTLDAWLATRPERAAIFDALLASGRGLAAAHAAGLVHRDFKPHNVLRGLDGHVYVTDFGLARGQIEDGPELVQVPSASTAIDPTDARAPRRSPDAVLDSPLTQTGVLVGTPAYMAPEQFAGHAPDPKSDQFAFCVTAWEALTGERPFRGSTLEELEAAGRVGAAALSGDLPPAIRAVLVRGLDPSPGARWPDLPALLAAFGEAIAEPRPPRVRRWMVAASIGALVLGGGITAFALLRGQGADDCVPADEAFASAWSPQRREVFRSNHPGGEQVGAFVLVEELRRRWSRSYTATCAAPRTAETRERLRCLLSARDDVARTMTRLEPATSELDFGALASLAAGLMLCDPTLLDHGEVPEPPAPPPPPGP